MTVLLGCGHRGKMSDPERGMGERQVRRMTPEEFFEWQKRQDMNYELVDGLPVLPLKAMTGASRLHDRLVVRALASLERQLRGTPCQTATDDIAVRTPRGVRRPDVMVDCGPFDPKAMEAAEPRLVIEVLSPSTMSYDRFRKVEEYKAVPAIRAILLVDTEAPRVTVWRRSAEGWGSHEEAGLGAAIELPEIGARLALADLYEGVAFGE
jgi:Uma2 family endonuclease